MASDGVQGGNGDFDTAETREWLDSLTAVLQTHGPADTLNLLRKEPVDLVLVNRKLDQDYSDGLDIIKSIKADENLKKVPCMIVSNYPDQQQIAVAAGAEYGFGKKELYAEATKERLAKFLTPDS